MPAEYTNKLASVQIKCPSTNPKVLEISN